MKVSRHALKRWDERFPDLDLEEEFLKAHRVGRRTKKRIGRQAPKNFAQMQANARHYLMNRHSKIVFVVSSLDQTVITVFPFEELPVYVPIKLPGLANE